MASNLPLFVSLENWRIRTNVAHFMETTVNSGLSPLYRMIMSGSRASLFTCAVKKKRIYNLQQRNRKQNHCETFCIFDKVVYYYDERLLVYDMLSKKRCTSIEFLSRAGFILSLCELLFSKLRWIVFNIRVTGKCVSVL